MARFSARTLHAIAEELGCAPELVAKLAVELKPRSTEQLKAACIAWIANDAAQQRAEDGVADTGKRKAPLTLSQRRALVKLQASPQTPASAFRAMPFEYLVSVDLAELVGDAYVLTVEGADRAATINPLYVRWAAGETVIGDPTRPPAGTHRAEATILL